MMKIKGSVFLLIVLAFFACNSEPQFTIEGEVTDGEDNMLYLEHRELNKVTVIDSVKLGANGKFELKGKSPQYPDLYTLRFADQYINLGIDSTETVIIKTTKDKFASNYTVEGSQNCKEIQEITLKNIELSNEIRILQKKHQTKELSDSAFYNSALTAITRLKDPTIKIIAAQPWSIVAYYGVFQKINGELLFDPNDKKDSKIYGAVATQWDNRYKESERAKHLHNFVLRGMKVAHMQNAQNKLLKNMSEANDHILLEIALPDIKGNIINLKSLIGKPIILDFTAYMTEQSPTHNMNLNKVHEKYGSNVIIYQISFDNDTHQWKNAAVNLPWFCVHDQEGIQSSWLLKYNIQELPTTFIIDKAGNIVKRISEKDNLINEVTKVL